MVGYAYAEANRVWTIDHRDSGGLTMLKLTYEYDRREPPVSITEDNLDGSTAFVEFEYDNRGRLYHETRDGETPYDLWYAYDQGGNRIAKTDTLNDTETAYHYDLEDPDLYDSANNRLMYTETYDVSPGDGTPLSSPLDKGGPEGGARARDGVLLSTTWYYYNGVGNVTRVVTHPEGTEDYSATRLVYAVNGSTLSYVTGETWTWDGVAPWPDNYDIIFAREFRYDGARQRYLNRQLDAEQLKQYGLVMPVLDTWSDYDGDDIYADFTLDGSTVTDVACYEPGVGRLTLASDPATVQYYHGDRVDTRHLMSNSSGANMLPVGYTAFGELLQASTGRYGYVGAQGYEAHDEFPYLHVGHRYYDPGTGRFLQRDPIGIEGGLNVYVYVNGTPTDAVDPDGLQRASRPFHPGPRRPLPYRPPGLDVITAPDSPFPDELTRPRSIGNAVANCVMIITGGPYIPPSPPKPSEICPVCHKPYNGHDHLHAAKPPRKPNRQQPARPHPSRSPGRRPIAAECFVPGTLVMTELGAIPIEDVLPDTMVPTFDPYAGIQANAPVAAVHAGSTSSIVVLEVEGEAIKCTSNHPFWVVGQGWIRAADLRAGHRLLSLNGESVPIREVGLKTAQHAREVYNLTVEGAHTYFIGNIGVLVHNKHQY